MTGNLIVDSSVLKLEQKCTGARYVGNKLGVCDLRQAMDDTAPKAAVIERHGLSTRVPISRQLIFIKHRISRCAHISQSYGQ